MATFRWGPPKVEAYESKSGKLFKTWAEACENDQKEKDQSARSEVAKYLDKLKFSEVQPDGPRFDLDSYNQWVVSTYWLKLREEFNKIYEKYYT